MNRLLLCLCCCFSGTLAGQDFMPQTVVCQEGAYALQSPLTDGETYVYQWERSFDGGGSWSETGDGTDSLLVASPTAGIRYRLHYATDATCLADPGCRSTTTATELSVQIPSFSQGVSRCAGDTLFVGNTPLTTPGNHHTVLRTPDGCDSVVTTFLQILSRADDLFFVDLCPGESLNGIPIHRDTMITESYASINGCDSTVTYEVNVALDADRGLMIEGPLAVCNGEAATLSAPGQFASYRWSTGETTPDISPAAAGTYELTLTNFAGCTLSLTHELTFVELDISGVDVTPPACPGEATGRINILASGDDDLLYSIDGGESFRMESEFTGLAAGNYAIVVESADGCAATSTAEIAAAPALELATDAPQEQTIERGDSVALTLTPNFPVVTWNWTPAGQLSDPTAGTTLAFPMTDVEYHVEAVAEGGCSVRDTFRITVMDSRRFYAPTAFSPNNDDKNDRWRLFPGPRAVAVTNLQIVDRWGGVRYVQTETELPPAEAGWDGTENGTPLPPGTYSYAAAIRFRDGSTLPVSGHITLLR